MKLVVGLGNPGKEYANSRHNTGALCVQLLAKQMGVPLERKSRLATLAEGDLAGQRTALAVPRTFMNTSGGAVSGLLQRYGIKPQDLILVYDDLDLPLGTIRVRPSGSSAGHNGVKSVIAALGTEQFPRVRIGIDRPVQGGADQIAYVLSAFTRAEQAQLNKALERAAEAVVCVLAGGVDATMNRYNRKDTPDNNP
ncbi:MAG: aminoacyl-tRNA hydrolase [Dehalococcoidia bacterium]|nr:aminoacyl-tRNA hydrolase [Dehalococcoidia bacterium]